MIDYTSQNTQKQHCSQNLKNRRRETAHLQENVGDDKLQVPSVAKSKSARAYDAEILCKLGQHLFIMQKRKRANP